MKVDDLLTVNNRESRVVGEGGAPEVNNLVYTKRQKHIYGNWKHETTAHANHSIPFYNPYIM